MPLLRSLSKSVGNAVRHDPEVQKLIQRYPRTFSFLKKRLTRNEKFGLTLTIGVILFSIFAYFFFKVLYQLFREGPIAQADARIINFLQEVHTPLFTKTMLLVTYLGDLKVILVGMSLVTIFLLLSRRWHYLVALFASVLGGEAFVYLLKQIIHRPRPVFAQTFLHETGFSFPSGHAFIALSFYGLLFYFLFKATTKKTIKALCISGAVLTAILIAFSRTYFGVHWPTDVFASLAAGLAWLVVIITALEVSKSFHTFDNNHPLIGKNSFALIGIMFFALFTFHLGYYYATHDISQTELSTQKTIPINPTNIPEAFFTEYSRYSEGLTGAHAEPINLIFIGNQTQLEHAFNHSGWYIADQVTFGHTYGIVKAAVLKTPYPSAEGSPSFWESKPNDFAYEKPTPRNTVGERHHIHFWKTDFTVEGKPVWLCTAHYDEHLILKPSIFFATHIINPNVDKERIYITSDLVADTKKREEYQLVEPMVGDNDGGATFFTDGKVEVIYLKE